MNRPGRKRWTTPALVRVCPVGSCVRNAPPPASASGISSWSARCSPTGTSAASQAIACAEARSATCSAVTRRSPCTAISSPHGSAASSSSSTLPGPAASTRSMRQWSGWTSSRLRTVRSSRSAIWFGRLAIRTRARRGAAAVRSRSSIGARRPGVIVATNSPPPAGAKPWRRSVRSRPAPMRRSTGANTCCRKSNDGASGLCVPPDSVTADGTSAHNSAGSTVCSTSVVLPAVPTANRCSPARIPRGRKRSDVEPSSAPSTSAWPTAAAASTAVRCWRASPGCLRPARILSMANGWPVTSDSPSAVRSTWPPPSPNDPSRRSIVSPSRRRPASACARPRRDPAAPP